MTETSAPVSAPVLSEIANQFILHWGEMGARWGINRSVAQIHALLYISDRPLNAEEIVALLGLARSNVSTGLRELQGWGLVHVVHLSRDRRDHFITTSDAWETCQIILAERKRRELDPAITLLRGCLAEGKGKCGGLAETRMRDLLEIFEMASAFHAHTRGIPKVTLLKVLKLGAQAATLIDSALSRISPAKTKERK
jgi:DNA-binding transcriptional regulator GbsR (MarR family)